MAATVASKWFLEYFHKKIVDFRGLCLRSFHGIKYFWLWCPGWLKERRAIFSGLNHDRSWCLLSDCNSLFQIIIGLHLEPNTIVMFVHIMLNEHNFLIRINDVWKSFTRSRAFRCLCSFQPYFLLHRRFLALFKSCKVWVEVYISIFGKRSSLTRSELLPIVVRSASDFA